MDISFEILAGIATIVIVVIAYLFMRSRGRSERRSSQSRRFGSEPEQEPRGNPFIPDWMEKHPGHAAAVAVIALILIVTFIDCLHTVPPGHRGVVITMGKVKPVNLGEGLQFKLPYIQRIVDMKVTLEKEEVTESTASSDLQEITTTLTVHFNIKPECAWQMYQNMRQNYHSLLLQPKIQEDLKATTAQFTAEQLIRTRALLVQTLTDKLDESLDPYGINVQTVNFVNFEFTPVFMNAIEAKVTQEQRALEAKNKLLQVQYEAQQRIIEAEAERNATIINADAAAQQKIISATAEARRITIEANATAEAMRLITSQMTPEYQRYLYLMTWSGELPDTLVGELEQLGLILDLGK